MGSKWLIVLVVVPVTLGACGTFGSEFNGTIGENGDGGDSGEGFSNSDGALGDTGAGSSNGILTVTIRDFKLYNAGDTTTDPDFENYPHINPADGGFYDPNYYGNEDDSEIVTDTLGGDGKPVYKNTAGTTITTHGKVAFDKWYRDTPGTNIAVAYPIQLTLNDAGAFEYDSEKVGVALSTSDSTKMFFPIDDGTPYATAFGNQGDDHNYSFTAELHTQFTYNGGESFYFRGDDDVFVYIDEKRVINLGGIHGPEIAQVNVDDLGLTKGQDYPLDFFSAERHKVGSNILFTTTLNLRPVTIR